jgi:L-ascorbate metabolism protein UlaG (beta-lactamase superfamily)
MVSGAHRVHEGFAVQAVEAHHVSITATESGFISGQPLSFVIRPAGESGISIYHSGDTSLFSDMKLIAELYEPQLGLIGVGGPEDLPHEMTAKEAAIAVDWLGVAHAIPMHWVPGAAHPQDFAAAVAARTPKVRVDLLQPGDGLEVGI